MIWIRRILFVIAGVIGALIIFLLLSILPIDRSPYPKELFKTMMKRIDTLKVKSIQSPSAGFSVGFSKVNLTPSHPTSEAGYGAKLGKVYSSVRDSIFVRTMVVTQGNTKVALVTADLLLIPPTVTAVLQRELPEIGFSLDNTYLGATHTHNSIGNWGHGVISVLYGSYNDSIVHFIADKIKESIAKASGNLLPATIKTGHFPVGRAVYNRLDEHGGIDSLLRVMEVNRSDGSKLLFLSYTAHATCLDMDDLQLSRDYPGKLVDELETHGYSFAMFMAGAVGSHGCNPPERGGSCVNWMAEVITQKFLLHQKELKPLQDSTLVMYRIPLELRNPQVKVSQDWCVRPWLFRAAFGEERPFITALKMSNLVMMGTPCDFSGELMSPLDSLANKVNEQVIVTSFNGGYIGYITPNHYYDVDHYETRLMNWYGPGSGEYLADCLERLMRITENPN